MNLRPEQKRTLVTVWLTYGTFYLCRVNIGPARTSIERDIAIGTVEMGLVLGALKIGYAVGQLVNGQLAERYGAKRILVIGMIGSAIATALFAFAPELAAAPGLRSVLPSVADGIGSVTGPVSTTAALLVIL